MYSIVYKPGLFLIVYLLSAATQHSQLKTEREKAELKGPVKEVQLETGNFDSNKTGIDQERCCSLIYTLTFDHSGRLIKEVNKDYLFKNDYLPPRKESNYDSKNRLLEEKSYDTDGAYLGKDVYLHDAAGKLKEIKSFRKDGTLYYRKTFTYDDRQNLIEQAAFYENDLPANKQIYTEHDLYGNWLKKITYMWKNESGAYIWRPISVYYRKIIYY